MAAVLKDWGIVQEALSMTPHSDFWLQDLVKAEQLAPQNLRVSARIEEELKRQNTNTGDLKHLGAENQSEPPVLGTQHAGRVAVVARLRAVAEVLEGY